MKRKEFEMKTPAGCTWGTMEDVERITAQNAFEKLHKIGFYAEKKTAALLK